MVQAPEAPSTPKTATASTNVVKEPPEPSPAPSESALPVALSPFVAPERFELRDPPRKEPEPFVLPEKEKAWFALAEVTANDPAESEPRVCAADRSLNTAVTWAKSPAEASEQALREGKLVFLIHVSGNFENPGFT